MTPEYLTTNHRQRLRHGHHHTMLPHSTKTNNLLVHTMKFRTTMRLHSNILMRKHITSKDILSQPSILHIMSRRPYPS